MTGIERLRELGGAVSHGVRLYDVTSRDYDEREGLSYRNCGGFLGEIVSDIADQIEREQRRDPAEDVSVSAYDLLPQEDRGAIAWVREHGGLDSVKKLLDWVVGHCSTKQQLDFDFWLSGRVMHELGFEEDMADRDEVERRLLARLMPEGMEWLIEAWPRFEDGEPVRIGDEVSVTVHDEDGDFERSMTADSISFGEHGIIVCDPCHAVRLLSGERVKRPAPKVLDADGVEICVGDTVWATNGHGPFEVTRIVYADRLRVIADDEKNGHLNAYPEMLTHRAPVLAADDKPLEAGQTVWSIEDGGPYKVDAPLSVDCYGVRLLNGRTPFRRSPDTITHERPVLDADGVPIKVGDTVYFTDGREQECNTVVYAEYDYKDEPYVQLGRLNDVGYPTYTNCSCIDPSQLTHTKPEPPDSWERLEEDAEKDPCGYFGFDGEETCGKCPASGKNCEQTMALDIVRRARALAERER